MRAKLGGGAKQADQFGVEDVHRLGLERDARPGFLFPHPTLESLNDFLGLADVEICFLQGTSKALRHVTKFFFVQPTLGLEETEGPENPL